MDDRLFSDPELAQFYDHENGWAADQAYCLGLAREAGSVLDLGCGTGLLLAHLAQEDEAGARKAVGVDPAAAMLQIARQQPGGERVTWIEADARTLRLEQRFDLIVLTGHAFQVFLSDADIRAVLTTIAAHLAPQGRFVFDSREPAAAAWRRWTPEASRRAFQHPELGRVEAWEDASHDAETGIVTYLTHYRIAATGQHLSANSKIRFASRDRLAALMAEAGLTVERWLGDWHGAPYGPGSAEIIPFGRLR